jgi:hypothetical protein
VSGHTFKAGETVYSQHGQEAEFVAHSGGEFIVRPLYEDDEGQQSGDVETWRTVFRTAPAPKLDAETAEAEKRRAELQLEVSELEGQKYALERGEKERLERIKRHEELAELEQYLAGGITHYVATHTYYPTVEIIPVAETVEDYHSNDGYGLLQLMPRKGWDKKIHWTVTYRVRGRYENSRTCMVVPCCGEEAAHAKAVEVVREIVAAYLGKDRKQRSYADQLVKSCERFGVEVPEELTAGIAAALREATEARIAEHRAKLQQAEAELAAIAKAEVQS